MPMAISLHTGRDQTTIRTITLDRINEIHCMGLRASGRRSTGTEHDILKTEVENHQRKGVSRRGGG